MTEISWLSTNKKKVIVHSLILGAFLLYAVFFSGPVFERFERIENESRLRDISLPEETNNIRYEFTLYFRTDIVEMMGWAFVEGQSLENSQTYVVLKSADNTCSFEASVWSEIHLNEQMGIETPDLRRAGFVAYIPLNKLNTGRYDVGIYISEGSIQALQYTDKALVKSGSSAKETFPQSRLQYLQLPGESGNITFGIDSLQSVTEEAAEFESISGWAFVNGQSSVNSRIYIFLISDAEIYVFNTVAKAVPNITRRYQTLNMNLTYSGFTAKISKELIKGGTYELGIYVEGPAYKAMTRTGLPVEIVNPAPNKEVAAW